MTVTAAALPTSFVILNDRSSRAAARVLLYYIYYEMKSEADDERADIYKLPAAREYK